MDTSAGFRPFLQNLTLRTKLIVVFGLQLLFIVAIGLTALFALRTVARQREALQTAQRLEVLALNLQLEFVEARTIQSNFVHGWTEVGFDEAANLYVPQHAHEVDELRKTIVEIEDLLESSTLQSAPRALSSIKTLAGITDFYELRFEDVVADVRQLAGEDGGALISLNERALALEDSGRAMADADVAMTIAVVREHEAEYLLTGEAHHLALLKDAAIETDLHLAAFNSENSFAAQAALEAYLQQIDFVEQQLNIFGETSGDLDQLISDAEPIWNEVAELGRVEAESALAITNQVTRLANVALGASIGLTVIVGAIITLMLWRGINFNLSRLMSATQRLEEGDMGARVHLDTGDEFGQLGATFDAMAGQVESMMVRLEEQTVEQMRDLETIADISRAITGIQSSDLLLESVVELIRERFGFYHAQVFLLDEQAMYAVLRESAGDAGRVLLERGHRLKVGSESVIGKVTGEGVPVIALDTDTDPTHRRNELLPNTRSELALPLRIGEQIIGVLDVQSTEPDAFSEDNLRVFQTMADQLAVALDNARLFEESRAALAEVETLNRQLTGQAWGQVAVREKSGGAMGFRMENGELFPMTDNLDSDKFADNSDGAVVVREDGQDGGFIVSIPIRIRGELIGAFEFGGEGISPPHADDIALIEAITDRMGQALENRRLFEQTQRVAHRERLVNQITSRIVGSTDVDEILQTTVKELGKVIRSPRTRIRLYREGEDE